MLAAACQCPAHASDAGAQDAGLVEARDGGDGGEDSGTHCAANLDCQGACVDTLSDVSNCGACGSVCPSSPADAGPTACVGGRCLLTLTRQPATGIALWGSTLFGTNLGAFSPGGPIAWRIDLDAGRFTALLAASPQYQGAEAPFVDGSSLWLFGGTYIMAIALDGGPPAIAPLHGEQGSYVDATWIYEGPPNVSSGVARQLRDLPLTATPELLADDATAFAVNDGYLYWASSGTMAADCTDGAILVRPLSGGAPRVLASGQHQPTALTLDQDRLYWLNLGAEGCVSGAVPQPEDGALMSVERDGGPAVALVTGLTWPGSLAIGGSTIYWTDNVLSESDVHVEAFSLDGGGQPVLLADGQPSLIAPALIASGGALFWADLGTTDAGFRDGRVMELLPVEAAPPPRTRPLGALCATDAECATGACCGGACVDLSSDLGSCGGCSQPCSTGQTCNGGSCASDCAQTEPSCRSCTGNGAVLCLAAGGLCLPTITGAAGCGDGGCDYLCASDCSLSGWCPVGFSCAPLAVPSVLGICACGNRSGHGTPCWCVDGGVAGTSGCRTTADCPETPCLAGGTCAGTGGSCSSGADCPQPACVLGECVLGYGCLPAVPISCSLDGGLCPGGRPAP